MRARPSPSQRLEAPLANILPLITLPDPLLRSTSTLIERVDDDLERLIDDMFLTMYEAPGIGLAAVQVGVPRRLLIMDVSKGEEEPRAPIVMINPELLKVESEELRLHEEGCLSIPEIYAEVERPNAVRMRYLDRAGLRQEMLCEGILSTVVQHELDHLDGKLFIDYLSRLKRDRIVRKFVKAERIKA
jgi:peptide deformylase